MARLGASGPGVPRWWALACFGRVAGGRGATLSWLVTAACSVVVAGGERVGVGDAFLGLFLPTTVHSSVSIVVFTFGESVIVKVVVSWEMLSMVVCRWCRVGDQCGLVP